VFLAVFVPLAILQYYARSDYARGLREQADHRRYAAARAALATLDDAFEDLIEELQLAGSALGHPVRVESAYAVLDSLVTQDPDLLGVGLLDTYTGSRVRRPPLRHQEREADLPAGDFRRPSISPVSLFHGQRVFTVSVPVEMVNGRMGVLYAVVTTDALARALERALDQSCALVVTDQNALAACQLGLQIKDRRVRYLGQSDRAGGPRPEETALVGRTRAASLTSPASGWRVTVVSKQAAAMGLAGNVRWLIWSGSITVAALAILLVISSRIRSPIRKLSRAAAAVAVGDLRRRVNIRTGDELQSLADSFNQMAASLERHDRELRTKTALLESLLDVARTMTASLDLDRVAAAISEALEQKFGARRVVIFRTEGEDARLVPILPRQPEAEGIPTAMLDLAEHALNAPKSVSVPAPVIYPSSVGEGCTVVALPLVVGSRRAGVLTAAFPGGENSSVDIEGAMDFLDTFASSAAVAVENAYIHSRTEELNHALDCLRRVVEAVSSSLDLNQVLRSLVRTTAEVMGAKACAILLAGRGGRLSVAEAHNMGANFRERLVVAPGERWSGIAFSEKRPIARVDLATETDLRLRDLVEREGLHGYICAPLVAGEEAIGTLNVWMAGPYHAKPAEIHLLMSIAGHAGAVIANAKLFGKEYQISEILQTTLISPVPDRLGRFAFGHKYLPALDEARVGGDMLDVLTLPNGKIGLVVADVSGKGIQAAVHTAMIRHMGRAFAFEWPDSPGVVLDLLNRALAAHLGTRAFVTVFYAVIDPETGNMVYANAGHPPAIALTRGGKQQLMLYRTGMPIGYSPDSRYAEKSVMLSPGDTLFLYTDGIVEAKRGDQAVSIEGLQDLLFRHAHLSPRQMVERICEETSGLADTELRDDIAVIAASVGPRPAGQSLSTDH